MEEEARLLNEEWANNPRWEGVERPYFAEEVIRLRGSIREEHTLAHPDLDEAARFAEAIHAEFPDKKLAYNCSPSFNWKQHLDDGTIAKFQQELGAMGYTFQFITLAGFHALNASMFELARGYADEGMTAYVRLQEHEFDMEKDGYTATRHQREVGAGYFDQVAQVISGGAASTLAMHGSTEEEQF
jgi:isocitrate lyase